MSKKPELVAQYHTAPIHQTAHWSPQCHVIISDSTSDADRSTFYLVKKWEKFSKDRVVINTPTGLVQIMIERPIIHTNFKLYLKDAKYVTFKKNTK